MQASVLFRHFLVLGTTLLCFAACSPQTDGKSMPEDEAATHDAAQIRRAYHPDGSLLAEVPVMNGLQHGTLTEYYPNGTRKASQDWDRGRALGQHTVFDESGTLVYHALSEYEMHEGAHFLAYAVLLNDSTARFSSANRVVIEDMGALLRSVAVMPPGALRFGLDNEVHITVPNVPNFSASVNNATITKAKHPDAYVIRPTVPGKNVLLSLVAHVNDTTLEFVPVELEVR